MSACVRLCCGDKNCDAAFMLETNCYAVTCLEEDLCTPVHAKKSGALISLNPKISYITSRSEEGNGYRKSLLGGCFAVIYPGTKELSQTGGGHDASREGCFLFLH